MAARDGLASTTTATSRGLQRNESSPTFSATPKFLSASPDFETPGPCNVMFEFHGKPSFSPKFISATPEAENSVWRN